MLNTNLLHRDLKNVEVGAEVMKDEAVTEEAMTDEWHSADNPAIPALFQSTKRNTILMEHVDLALLLKILCNFASPCRAPSTMLAE